MAEQLASFYKRKSNRKLLNIKEFKLKKNKTTNFVLMIKRIRCGN